MGKERHGTSEYTGHYDYQGKDYGKYSQYGENYGEGYGKEYGEDYGEDYGKNYAKDYVEDNGNRYGKDYGKDYYSNLKPPYNVYSYLYGKKHGSKPTIPLYHT